MQEFNRSLTMLLYRALHSVLPPFRAVFAASGLTEPQWRVLRVLWEHEDLAFRELAELTLVPAPSLVGVADRLHARGLVGRRRSTRDRRQVYVHATAAGRALEAELMPAVEACYRDLRATLDDATWAGLVRGLEALGSAPRPASSTAPARVATPAPARSSPGRRKRGGPTRRAAT